MKRKKRTFQILFRWSAHKAVPPLSKTWAPWKRYLRPNSSKSEVIESWSHCMRSIRSGDREHFSRYQAKKAKNHWQLPLSRKLMETINNSCKTKTVYHLIQRCSCLTHDNYSSILRHLTLQMLHAIIFLLPTIWGKCKTQLSVDTNNSYLTSTVLKACEARKNYLILAHSRPKATISPLNNQLKVKFQQLIHIDNSRGYPNMYSCNFNSMSSKMLWFQSKIG